MPVEDVRTADFEPSNDLESVLARCVQTGSRARLLRALARSDLCFLAAPAAAGPPAPVAGEDVSVPCVADAEGRHALVYTSERQLEKANPAAADWIEVAAGELFERWPTDVDIWLNAGGELGFPLGNADIDTVADLAAGLEVAEAYEVGPGDEFSEFPGPSVPDEVDNAVVLALFQRPEIVEIVRNFRRLDEPGGRTWRVILILLDGVQGAHVAETAVRAINDAADECCEVHVADLQDDGVYDVVLPLVRVGRPLWRRDGLEVPQTAERLERWDLDGREKGDGEEPQLDV